MSSTTTSGTAETLSYSKSGPSASSDYRTFIGRWTNIAGTWRLSRWWFGSDAGETIHDLVNKTGVPHFEWNHLRKIEEAMMQAKEPDKALQGAANIISHWSNQPHHLIGSPTGHWWADRKDVQNEFRISKIEFDNSDNRRRAEQAMSDLFSHMNHCRHHQRKGNKSMGISSVSGHPTGWQELQWGSRKAYARRPAWMKKAGPSIFHIGGYDLVSSVMRLLDVVEDVANSHLGSRTPSDANIVLDNCILALGDLAISEEKRGVFPPNIFFSGDLSLAEVSFPTWCELITLTCVAVINARERFKKSFGPVKRSLQGIEA